MPSKSVKVPKYLKQKMAEHKEANWSEVARNAMYDHLSKIEKKPEPIIETAAETPENRGAFANALAGIDNKKKLYLVAGIAGLFVLIAFWQYILIGGLIAGIIYLRMRRQKA